MDSLGYKAIDVDNHYYEPLDAFTRHLDKKFRRRGVQMVTDGRHTQVIIGDRVNRFIPNPTFDPIIVPGCLDLLFRGEIPDGVDPASLMKVEKLELRPEYRDRDARVAVVESQGIETIFMFPTFGCGVEEALKADIEATAASLHAFNLWLDEDWGFDRPDHRIIAAPMISLADPEKALQEVEFVLERGARMVHVRPAPVPGVPRNRSLGHRSHDRVWARLVEANVPVAFHLGDSGYLEIAGMWGGKETFEPFAAPPDPLDKILVDDRAIHDTMASLIVHGVFDRHPTLRVASIENGSEWVHRLAKRLKKLANQHPRSFPNDPVDALREHVWISPYYEEDLTVLADRIGVDRILFGSDWPHGEGLESPLAFTEELTGFSRAEVQKIMRDNALDFLGVTVASAA
ncbi:amidohydrolase family protein [Mycobacterium marinum]|uniref:amidohydrolase family protein n=1 Tax=Mycobacterium marinum TaxID=1781 RepID=UPI0023406757|nr:amidohydrolase family protein [Mycobacterium marinum]MDC8982736.1 amidohydrolase family protein [Mycobacterium marinum]MDC8993461.1 amidohydrolase family protein [Mycobacterium marinum]MDC8999445.1 amidohydrolase family protein [Mycobacterium marinum]MDC9010092.1 amidohydrolase family protein [Mycobacterium marinum]MDC9014956.1 amidohydrolase family protein [Mycobacterium marinum]